MEECGPVAFGDLALPARIVLDFNRGIGILCRVLGCNDFGDDSTVILFATHPNVADLDVLGIHFAASLANNVFHTDEILLMAAIAAFLAVVPPLFVCDPMGATCTRNGLKATFVIQEPDETFLGIYVLVDFLDGVLFSLSSHFLNLQVPRRKTDPPFLRFER